ncbi:hypothetical protein [Dysgonomonas sp. ZJ709]|uniref:hypothetical protein n=1 Tax=Dysgonomonas sp. ZJ709 TaxID=2709797 RepID=UPI0013ED5088|nr:hypothetical protein [Dysgonomonas sp. ZJ709]
MAKLTIKVIKEILTINSKCGNGFQFDKEDFILLGDKNLSKVLTVTDDYKIKATLYFQNEINKDRQTGNQIPVMNVSVWIKPEDSTMWESGLGKFHYFKDKVVPRKKMSILQELTKEVTEEMIRELAVDNRDESII